MDKIKRLQEMVDESNSIVFFGGAGVSTESGIPDFRSVDGIYNMNYKYPPETILSHSFFFDNTVEFYRFTYDKLMVEGIEPNDAHKKLAELEACGKLKAVITQNIDGLHQLAGSKKVLELHGSTQRSYCLKCGKKFDGEYILSAKKNNIPIPKCDACGGNIKLDVVLYEEPLDQDVVEESISAIANADMLIIGGTSLVVYPAAGLVDYFRGKHLVLINKGETSHDSHADLVINEPIGATLAQIVTK